MTACCSCATARLIADATPDGLRAQAGTDDLEEAFLVLAEKDAA